MAVQFIINDKGERTGAIIPIAEYEDLLHNKHRRSTLLDQYKKVKDSAIADGAITDDEEAQLKKLAKKLGLSK